MCEPSEVLHGFGRRADRPPRRFVFYRAAGAAEQIGSRTGLAYTEFWTGTPGGGVELALIFDQPARHARVIRHYLCYPSAPVIETYTSFESTAEGARFTVADLNAYRLSVTRGEVTWLTGLGASEDLGGAFTVRRQTVATARLDIGSEGRSSERAVPYFAIETESGTEEGETSATESFFGGLMWSGAWALTIEPAGPRLRATLGLSGMSTAVQPLSHVDTPHGFFGVASTRAIKASSALRAFIEHAVRGGRPFRPLVAYNSWFVRGSWIDETSTREEIDRAARLGAEVFVLDAGWWAGAGSLDQFDYDTGVGSWCADPDRFPGGLASVADYARSKGLKFGMWVEPERIYLDLVDLEGGAADVWLATRDGRRNPGVPVEEERTAQICLGSADARQWLFDRLTELIDQVRPDWLKWDNNFWIDCNRTDHGHGAHDGNFAHVAGLYDLLTRLRERYPDLIIENCAGGGHRLDLGMARYTDLAWMDDRTAPSSRVRHNLEGLSRAFPAPYLFSFVLGEETADVPEGTDLALWFRSRMPGALGLGDGALADTWDAIREIDIYKRIREIQLHASSDLLSPQLGGAGGTPAWDVIQQLSDQNGDALIFAFQVDPGSESVVVHPKWLDPERKYRVESVDTGVIGEASGAELMEAGIEVVDTPFSDAHILILRMLTPDPPAGESAAGAPVKPARTIR